MTCRSLTTANTPCKRRALPRSRYCWQHQSRLFKSLLGGGALVIVLGLLALFSDLDQLGILQFGSIFRRDPPPLRKVALVLSETVDGNPTADITVRNISDEPVVISEARVAVDQVLQLQACNDTPLSSLAPTGTYDIAIPFAKGAISKQFAQLVPPKSADRFQLVLAPAEADALYLVTITLFYNESRSSLELGQVVLFVDDYLVTDVPEPDHVSSDIRPECIDSNLSKARDFFQTHAERSTRVADLERRVNAYPRQPGLSPPSPDPSPPPAQPLPEDEVPLPVSEALRSVGVMLFLGKPAAGKLPVCQGSIVNKEWVLTVDHCLVNRRTGRRRELSEIIVVRVADLSEHSVTEVRLDPKGDLILLRVSPLFVLKEANPLRKLLKPPQHR